MGICRLLSRVRKVQLSRDPKLTIRASRFPSHACYWIPCSDLSTYNPHATPHYTPQRYTCSQIFAGYMSSKVGGKKVLFVGVCVWSAATFLCVPAFNFNPTAPALLVVARAVIGLAEGQCCTASPPSCKLHSGPDPAALVYPPFEDAALSC